MKVIIHENKAGSDIGEFIGAYAANTLAVAEDLISEGLSEVASFAKGVLLGIKPGFDSQRQWIKNGRPGI